MLALVAAICYLRVATVQGVVTTCTSIIIYAYRWCKYWTIPRDQRWKMEIKVFMAHGYPSSVLCLLAA